MLLHSGNAYPSLMRNCDFQLDVLSARTSHHWAWAGETITARTRSCGVSRETARYPPRYDLAFRHSRAGPANPTSQFFFSSTGQPAAGFQVLERACNHEFFSGHVMRCTSKLNMVPATTGPTTLHHENIYPSDQRATDIASRNM